MQGRSPYNKWVHILQTQSVVHTCAGKWKPSLGRPWRWLHCPDAARLRKLQCFVSVCVCKDERWGMLCKGEAFLLCKGEACVCMTQGSIGECVCVCVCVRKGERGEREVESHGRSTCVAPTCIKGLYKFVILSFTPHLQASLTLWSWDPALLSF